MSFLALSRYCLARSTGTQLPELYVADWAVVSLSRVAQCQSSTAKCIPTKLSLVMGIIMGMDLAEVSMPIPAPAHSRLHLPRSLEMQLHMVAVSMSMASQWPSHRASSVGTQLSDMVAVSLSSTRVILWPSHRAPLVGTQPHLGGAADSLSVAQCPS